MNDEARMIVTIKIKFFFLDFLNFFEMRMN